MTTQTATYPGQLDEGFANKGIARITIPGYSWLRIESVKSIGAGADQKIYFTGWCYNEDAPAPEDYFVLGRLNVDGSPDALFGTDGVVMGQFAGLDSQAKSLAIQDGNILLFGGANLGRPQKAPAFARFTSEGTLDKNFGDQGYTVLDIDLAPPAPASGQKAPPVAESAVSPYGVEILPDNKILAFMSYVFQDGQALGLIIRLNDDGALDLQFNQLGYIPVNHPAYITQATQLTNIMVQADGMYVGCGTVWDFVKPHVAIFVRFKPDGTPDTGFGERKDGFVLIEAPDAINGIRIEQAVRQPNNRILGIGNTFTSPQRMAALTSLEPDGKPNIQFNRGMPLYTALEENATTLWMGGAIQRDGKIVVVGGVGLPDDEVDIVVARFIDGTFDPAFNNGKGWVGTHIEDGTEAATGMALQEDGKILVSAYTAHSNGVILRYLP